MRFLQTLFHLITFFTVIQAITLPAAFNSLVESGSELHKRKGGGGGRAGGGSSGGSRGGSSSSSGSSGSSGNRGSSGGAPAAGSGTPRNFGGGSRYGGGAATPYRNTAASRSSWPGPTPFLLGAGALALFPGLWLYGAYAYPYSHRNNDDDDQNNGTAGTRTYLNETTNQNETRPVQCLCAQYEQCSCEDSTDQAYLNQVANDKEVSSVRNGTLYINGTLSNDTSAPGTTSDSAAGGLQQRLVEAVGYWPIIAGVAYTMWFL